MTLRVPGVEVDDEALAVGPWSIEVGVRHASAAEELVAPAPAAQLEGVLDRVSGLVPQNLHAPVVGAAFDLQHLVELEAREARVREVEGYGDSGHPVGREPLVREPEVGPEDQTPLVELGLKLRQPRLELAPGDRQLELRKPEIEELLVLPR